MPLSNTALNTMADAFRTTYTYLSLHSADPSTTGANTTTHGRIAHGATAATGSGDVTIPTASFTGGAANGAVTYVGFWTASTGGVWGGGFPLTGDQTSNAAGQYTVNSFVVDGSST